MVDKFIKDDPDYVSNKLFAGKDFRFKLSDLADEASKSFISQIGKVITCVECEDFTMVPLRCQSCKEVYCHHCAKKFKNGCKTQSCDQVSDL